MKIFINIFKKAFKEVVIFPGKENQLPYIVQWSDEEFVQWSDGSYIKW